jgi:hypothetical protein
MRRQRFGWIAFSLGFAAIFVAVRTAQLAAAEAAAKGYFLEEEPDESASVAGVKKDAKDGGEVVVVGRIGGRANPWINNAAAFSIVDEALKSCDQIPGDKCATPWDYCCESDIAKSTLLVMFVDDAGKVVKQDARKWLKVKELQTVVIQGKAKRDRAGNVTIMASRLFVRPEDQPIVK